MGSKPTYDELEARVRELEALLERRTYELTRELTEYIAVKTDLEKRTFELSQRIRELKSVLEITTASDQPDLTLQGFYHEVLKIVAASFQYPEITCAELRVGEQVYRTQNFIPTEWKIGRGLMEGSEMIGYLSAYYTENRGVEDFGPFTKEEKNLMVVITRYLVQIIKRKKFEEAVRKFEELIEQNPSYIIIINGMGVIEYVNGAFTKLMGYLPSEVIGKNIEFHEKSPGNQQTYHEMQQTIVAGGTWQGFLKGLRKDNTIVWLNNTIFPLFSETNITGYVAIGTDITYQKELEAQAQEQQAKYRLLMENIPLSLAILDFEGRCLFANQVANQMFGLNTTVEGKLIEEIFTPEVAREIHAEINSVIKKKKPMVIERSAIIGDKTLYYRTQRLPLINEDNRVYGVLLIAEDITERKRRDLLLKIQHKIDSLASVSTSLGASIKLAFRYLMQIDWVHGGGIYLFDDDEKHLRLIYSEGLVNEFVRQVAVYSKEDEPVRMILLKKPMFSKTKDFSRKNRDALMKHGITMAVSIPLVHENKVIGCLNLASKTIDEISESDRTIVESIGARLANLIMLLQTREKLVKTNRELQTSLREVKEKQEMLTQKSKLESLGELAAGLAHEINQPLSVIGLAFENINFKLAENSVNREYMLRKTETISRNIEKIRQLIEHVRIFARDQSSVMFEKIDVNRAILDTLAMVEPQLNMSRVEVHLDLSKCSCQTLGNMTKLEQVIMNLVSNAKDALDEKASLPAFAGFKKQIRISTEVQKQQIIVKVEDNGIGIHQDDLKRIFTPFFTTKPPGQGTGLGLPIVYGIVTEMKGTIEVTSEREKFSSILLTLIKI